MLKDKFNNYPKITKYYSKNNSPHHNSPKTVTSKTIHLSAPGYRSNSTGTLYGIGEGGYSYSSSVNGSKGMYLEWDATWLLPNNANSRGHGLQLRCLSE